MIRSLAHCLLFPLALAVSTGAVAAPAAQAPVRAGPAADRPASKLLALELARIGQPRELLVEGVLMGFDLAAAEQKQDEESLAVEKQFPGFLAALRARGRDELASIMTERAPILHERLAEVYVANLSDADMRAIIAFFQTPTGKKFVRAMAMSPPASNAADDLDLTEEELADAGKSAAGQAMKQMSGDEWIELVKFGMSPAGRANRALTTKVQPVVATVFTELMTDFAERMRPITLEVLEKYRKTAAK